MLLLPKGEAEDNPPEAVAPNGVLGAFAGFPKGDDWAPKAGPATFPKGEGEGAAALFNAANDVDVFITLLSEENGDDAGATLPPNPAGAAGVVDPSCPFDWGASSGLGTLYFCANF